MEDTTLFKIALFSSAIGIVVLFLISEVVTLKETRIEKIEEGDYVRISGEVTNLKTRPDLTLFNLQQEENSIKVVAFEEFKLKNNDNVEVEGKAENYKGQLEIKADLIKPL